MRTYFPYTSDSYNGYNFRYNHVTVAFSGSTFVGWVSVNRILLSMLSSNEHVTVSNLWVVCGHVTNPLDPQYERPRKSRAEKQLSCSHRVDKTKQEFIYTRAVAQRRRRNIYISKI